MKDYLINSFSIPCQCGGLVRFKIVIGKNQKDITDHLGFLAFCETCEKSSGMESDIQEAYSSSQA